MKTSAEEKGRGLLFGIFPFSRAASVLIFFGVSPSAGRETEIPAIPAYGLHSGPRLFHQNAVPLGRTDQIDHLSAASETEDVITC